MANDKQICSFMRITPQGFEKVTWYKRMDGTKYAVKSLVNPSPKQIREMMYAPFNEIIL